MAWITNDNGEQVWLAFEARAKLIAEYEEEVTLLRALIKADEAVTNDLQRLEHLLDELDQLRRVHRGEHDMLYFMYEYFSEERNPGNQANLIPEGQTLDTSSKFHTQLCSMLDDVTQGKVTTHIGWSVGRRHAKTAYLSNGYLTHQIVFRQRRYIVEISKTTDMAGDFATWARFQLKFNEKLRNDFGGLLHKKPSMNDLDNKYEFVTTNGIKIEAKGIQTQVRGMRYLSERPDLFILDDLEDEENTNTKELRAKNLSWFRSELMEAMGFGGACVYMGTIVHYDSLLNHVLTKRKDFKSEKFPSILHWSGREDLWEKWRNTYNADDPNAKENADSFYESNKYDMDADTEVLWPKMYNYKYFMEKREEIGSKAFNQEFLGNPVDEESQIFNPEEFTYYNESDLDGKELEFYAAVDFAMGKTRGDYSAITTLAKNTSTGVCYVVDSYLERVHPDKFLKVIVQKTLQYQYHGLAVESQMAQEWFADKLSEELVKQGYPAHTRLLKVKQKTRKELRIEALLPEIQAGRIRFLKQHRLLIEMLELFPNHNHDDGPDSLADAFKVAKSGNATVTTVKRQNRWQ